MLKIILIVLIVVISFALIMVMLKPNNFRVERSITIKAPPEKIFELINDYPSWVSWSPYEKKDPEMKRTLSGPSKGVGAVYEWDANNQVGKGRMETIEVSPPSRIIIQLDFFKPFEGHNTAEFTLESQGEFTKVTWAMFGPNNYIGKLMSVFINCDNMIGRDFDIGLANLKTLTEK